MGKKIKKALTGGIGKIKKLTEKLDPLGAGLLNPMVDPMADQYLGTDFTGAKKLAQEQADAANRLEQARQVTANVDLGQENVVQTEVAGTAQAQANSRRRRPGGGSSVASAVGIRV